MGLTSFDHFHPARRGQADVTGGQVDQVDMPVSGEWANLVGASNRFASALLMISPSFSSFALGLRANADSAGKESRSSRRSAQ